jgi:fermentation-respiration switch protein FrsA (DUF1100 family)
MAGAAWAIGLILLMLLGLPAAGLYFYSLAVTRRKKTFLSASPDLGDYSDSWGSDSKWMASQALEDVEIRAYDGLKLHAYFYAAAQPSQRLVIMAHGYSSKGLDGGGFARFYHDLGWHVLLPDSRGHGSSQGDYIGFGWPDRLDYLQWVQTMIARLGQDCQILLHGVSMGGATVLMVSGEDLPGQVKAIISDSAYTSAAEILAYQMKRLFKLPPFPLIQVVSLVCRLRAGYFFEQASALRQVKRAARPVLFIHGEADTFVPVAMAPRLVAACASPKELWTVPGAGHAMPFYVDRQGYQRRVLAFIDRFCPGFIS